MRAGAMMGGLAVAAITSTALSLFHELDATVMIRVWNLGTVVLITRLGTLLVLHSGIEHPGESGCGPNPDTPAADRRVLLLRCFCRAGHEARRPFLSSGPEDFHLRALPEPYVNLSIHTAPVARPFP